MTCVSLWPAYIFVVGVGVFKLPLTFWHNRMFLAHSEAVLPQPCCHFSQDLWLLLDGNDVRPRSGCHGEWQGALVQAWGPELLPYLTVMLKESSEVTGCDTQSTTASTQNSSAHSILHMHFFVFFPNLCVHLGLFPAGWAVKHRVFFKHKNREL